MNNFDNRIILDERAFNNQPRCSKVNRFCIKKIAPRFARPINFSTALLHFPIDARRKICFLLENFYEGLDSLISDFLGNFGDGFARMSQKHHRAFHSHFQNVFDGSITGLLFEDMRQMTRTDGDKFGQLVDGDRPRKIFVNVRDDFFQR